jgi:two-component system response regulator WspF
MRIAIVNDLSMAVFLLRRILESLSGCEVAWIAPDGAEAIEKCARDLPDLILMDLIMPGVDGVQATRHIMKNTPCAILIVTASVTGNAAMVFEAMGYGALDAVALPRSADGGADLLRKIERIGVLIGCAVRGTARAAAAASSELPRLVAIGASTGGPKALATVLRALPAGLAAAVTIVQHVDAKFAGDLVQWLSEQTELPVSLAREGMRPEKGSVFVAGTNDHLVLGADFAFHYTAEPADYPYRPSVDEFFVSLSSHWRRPGTAVLLTGMGRDGARGLLALRQAGWHTVAQDEKTSIVYGMPRAAKEAGAAAEVLPLSEIAASILINAG